MYRIGHGYDVHKLTEGRKLILCGVHINHELGLLGHSDADVAVHALMDSMLGALALGDIGKHFPDSDEKYKDISSIELLKHVNMLIKNNGYTISNADITIVAQRPKISGFIDQMRNNIAKATEIDVKNVSVKATTTERLGFEGKEEGISSTAVCLLKKVE